jgi:hypothetical protein
VVLPGRVRFCLLAVIGFLASPDRGSHEERAAGVMSPWSLGDARSRVTHAPQTSGRTHQTTPGVPSCEAVATRHGGEMVLRV